MFGIKWSDDFQKHVERSERISYWYHQAMESIQEGKATILGQPVNPLNHKEVIAFLFLMYKDYGLFHEKF